MAAHAIDARAARRSGLGLRRRSDEQLAKLAGRGDAAAFELLFERHHRHLLSFCRHMLGRSHDAEDAVQHAFTQAHRSFASGELPNNVKAWLYVVARNRCLSLLRARREQPGHEDVEPPSTEHLADEVQRRADLRDLLADLQRLPEQQRAALLLAELGDLSHDEVAAVIDVPAKKVKALVFQAREALLATADARSLPCAAVREEIASSSGAALRRRHLRLHLEQCEGCREFRARVKSQKVALAAVLPVAPTLLLREGVLGTVAGSGGGGLLAAILGKSVATKAVAGLAAVGAAAGGGTAVVQEVRDDPPAPIPRAVQADPAPRAPVVPAAAATRPAAPVSTPVVAKRAPVRKPRPKAVPAASKGAGTVAKAERKAEQAARKQERQAAKVERKAARAMVKANRAAQRKRPRPAPPRSARARANGKAAAPVLPRGRDEDKDTGKPDR